MHFPYKFWHLWISSISHTINFNYSYSFSFLIFFASYSHRKAKLIECAQNKVGKWQLSTYRRWMWILNTVTWLFYDIILMSWCHGLFDNQFQHSKHNFVPPSFGFSTMTFTKRIGCFFSIFGKIIFSHYVFTFIAYQVEDETLFALKQMKFHEMRKANVIEHEIFFWNENISILIKDIILCGLITGSVPRLTYMAKKNHKSISKEMKAIKLRKLISNCSDSFWNPIRGAKREAERTEKKQRSMKQPNIHTSKKDAGVYIWVNSVIHSSL